MRDDSQLPKNPQRRRLLTGVASTAVVAASSPLLKAAPAAFAEGLDGTRRLFQVGGTWINGAYMHPVSQASEQALQDHLAMRRLDRCGLNVDLPGRRTEAMERFAKLINADVDELAWVPSTTVGENLVAGALDLQRPGARVVTDGYHYSGSLYMYQSLCKQGADVQIIMPRDHRIDMNDLDAAIRPGTRLVAVSLVSNVNGFQHDLKQLCQLAHARGALVYADVIQAAGTTPLDVHASGVDFCACATYKWLMGDFGIGLLYVRKDRQSLLGRVQWGERQLSSFQTHMYPLDQPSLSGQPFTYEVRPGAGGQFEVGTLNYGGALVLGQSLALLLSLGVERIEQWRQPLLRRLREGLSEMGLDCMTPENSRSAILGFAGPDLESRLSAALQAENLYVSLYPHRMRISPSFFNGQDEVAHLLDVCRKALRNKTKV